jgi:LysM repeat protein
VIEINPNTGVFVKIKSRALILCLVLWLIFPGLTMVVYAQNETALELIDAVNLLRAQQGLAPYQVDTALMVYAQDHSDYQAAIQTSTDVHSDGSTPLDIGLQENVATGDIGVVTITSLINEIWSDFGQRAILLDYPTGQIGAGVAFSDSGQVYYTVDIRPGESVEGVTPSEVTSADPSLAQVILETVIPNPDGSIVHTVIEGDTLWSIATAYGVTINDILNLNGIPDESAIINIGQILIIRAAQVTATPLAEDEIETPDLNSELNQTVFPTALPAGVETITPNATATLMPEDSEPESSGLKITGWLIIYSFTFFTIIVQAIFNLIKTNRR